MTDIIYCTIILVLILVIHHLVCRNVKLRVALDVLQADKQPKLLEEAFQDAMFIYYRKCYGNYPVNGDMLINHNGKDYCYINNKWYTT